MWECTDVPIEQPEHINVRMYRCTNVPIEQPESECADVSAAADAD